jgi:hypothetical protein
MTFVPLVHQRVRGRDKRIDLLTTEDLPSPEFPEMMAAQEHFRWRN